MTIAALMLALIASTPAAEADARATILDFTSTHCGPCQQMRPEIERLIDKGYPVKAVDIDRDQALAQRYRVSAVPTFIVVDGKGRALARTEGYQPAGQIATLYRQARAKLAAARPAEEQVADAEDAPPAEEADAADPEESAGREGRPAAAATRENPKPWETVVRIKVHGPNSVGFGSGTIIYSTPEESIILTCAHIFHLEGGQQATPARFPRKISVDLFDGNLRGQMVHPVETVAGKAIDYDFTHDVGLILIRPGHRLPASPVVPKGWEPKVGTGLTTVGCSQGNDATAWSTRVVQPNFGAVSNGHAGYSGTLCVSAPKQGRSGGGLYTGDGYVAGVCDFADYEQDRGIYASPASIHRMLAKNNLQALYDRNADASGLMLVKGPGSAPAVVRGQSPDRAEVAARPRAKPITMPKPELLGIREPAAVASAEGRPRGRRSWTPAAPDRSEEGSAEAAPGSTAELQMDPAVADDAPALESPAEAAPPAPTPPVRGKWHAVKPAGAPRTTADFDRN